MHFSASVLALFTAFMANVKSETQFPDNQIIRYQFNDDYTTMNTWEDARDYCISKGHKLATWAQLCPDGKGPFKSPVGGMDDEHNWVAVEDNVEWYVYVANSKEGCGSEGCISCRGHIQHYGNKEKWGHGEDKGYGTGKAYWFNNSVFCHVTTTPNPTGHPSQNPTSVPTTLAPTSSPTALIEGAVGNGCENTIQLSHAFETAQGEPCNQCSFCAGSSLSSIYNPHIDSTCVECLSEDSTCNTLRLITSFQKSWIMKFFKLKSSGMNGNTDPEKIVLEGSNDLKEWHELYDSDLTFDSRNAYQDFVFGANEVSYKYYSISFKRQMESSVMHIGNYGIVNSYTEQCAANMFNDIVGSNVLPYNVDA